METHSGLYLFDDDNSTRLNTTKAEVITSMPDEVLANIEHVDENVGTDPAVYSRDETKGSFKLQLTITHMGAVLRL